MKDNIGEILNTSTITNISMPRMWSKGAGCIAHDVGEISTAYFHEQVSCANMNGFDTPEEQATHYPKWD